jgi:ketosteroid isomerase-like protein
VLEPNSDIGFAPIRARFGRFRRRSASTPNSCLANEPILAGVRAPVDASAIPRAVSAYYDALDAGDDDGAAAAFADDAVYIRPALDGRGIEIARGREGIRDLFARRAERKAVGENLHHHELRTVAVEGSECFVEGVGVTGEGPFAVFLAHATLDDDGLIRRYIGTLAETPGGFDA